MKKYEIKYTIKITARDERGNEVPILEDKSFAKGESAVEMNFDGLLLMGIARNEKDDNVNADIFMLNMSVYEVASCIASQKRLLRAAERALEEDRNDRGTQDVAVSDIAAGAEMIDNALQDALRDTYKAEDAEKTRKLQAGAMCKH